MINYINIFSCKIKQKRRNKKYNAFLEFTHSHYSEVYCSDKYPSYYGSTTKVQFVNSVIAEYDPDRKIGKSIYTFCNLCLLWEKEKNKKLPEQDKKIFWDAFTKIQPLYGEIKNIYR